MRFPRFLFEGDGEGAAGGAAGGEKKEAPATLSAEALAQIKAQSDAAIASAVKTANEEADARYQEALKARDKKLMNALRPDDEPDPEDINARLLARFVDSPADVLGTLAKEVSKRTRREVLGEMAEERTRIRSQNAALEEVLKTRPDIRGNRVAIEQLDVIYNHETDENLSDVDRFSKAVATFDRRVEAVGAPKAEDRIKAALPVKSTTTSGGGGGEGESSLGYQQRQAASLTSEKDDRIERYRKTHGGLRPPAVIRR